MNVGVVTVVVCVVAFVALVGWDIYAVVAGGEDATISHIIAAASKRFPIIAFAGGVLAGHFWWPNP